MNIKEVKDLIQEVLRSDISDFELEHTGTRLKLRRGFHRDSAMISSLPSTSSPSGLSAMHAPVSAQGEPQTELSEAADEESAFHIITAPIVGTFYRAPSPGSEPYVQLGDQVREGSTLCIVEAMKLMNEIPSDVEGEVSRIYVENGSPVEFGQKLFAIRPDRQG